MAENKGVVVTGIPELMRALKATDADLYKATRTEFKSIAKHVVAGAQAKMEFGAGTAAASVKAGGGIRGAWISFPRGAGRGDVDYYPWLDFGGGNPQGRGVTPSRARSLSMRRPFIKEGRYIYPAIAESTEFIIDTAADTIERVAKSNGFDVRGF